LDDEAREAAIRKIARDGDPDRYAATLFAPRRAREALLALYAFNVELARACEQVKEPQLGEIRLQWWRDALDAGLAGEPAQHTVIEAVARAAEEHGLSADALSGLIDARSFDVSTKIMPDEASLDAYLDRTAGALFRLAATIASEDGPADKETIDRASRAAGLAYGLTGLMRSAPVHAGLGRVDIPADALVRRGTSPGRVLIGETSEGLLDELKALRARASQALHEALPEIGKLPPSTRSAFLPLALVAPYLVALARADPLHEVAGINPLYRLWRLGTYKFR